MGGNRDRELKMVVRHPKCNGTIVGGVPGGATKIGDFFSGCIV